jgi:hypothetical protein
LSETQKVLKKLVAGTTGQKAEARELTPVGTERAGGTIPAAFPNDMPREVMAECITDIRRVVAKLLEAADALATAANLPEREPEVDVDAVKTAEKVADRKFAVEYAAKQKAAQAATFKQADADDLYDKAAAILDGWACPEHGVDNLHTVTSKTRTFLACATCKRFQKG